jgi:hypothetical protein
MSEETILEILRIIGLAICFGLPAYALLYFDGPEF